MDKSRLLFVFLGMTFLYSTSADASSGRKVSAGRNIAGSVGRPAAVRAPMHNDAVHNDETIEVGGTRRVQGIKVSLGQSRIEQQPPGTNPLKALAQLPGIMYQAADAQGVDVWSSQVFMHGFQQQELGFTLDDMPLGEVTYRNYNGLNPIMAISSENVERIDVSQSAGAEEIASTSNLGGSLSYKSIDPKDVMGGTVRQGFGSYGLFHTFARFDSGALNASGTKFFASYMRNDSRYWRGYGENFMQQINVKLVQPIGQHSRVAAFFDWSDLHNDGYQDLSPEILGTLGQRVSNYYNGRASGYIAAYQAAQGRFPAGYEKLSDPLDASYYDGATSTVDYFGGLKADIALGHNLTWTTTAYGHGEDNQTHWTTPYFPSPNGAPLSELSKQPSIQRFGVLSAMHYDIARNHIGIGAWYENDSYQSPMYVYSMPLVVNGVIQGSVPNGRVWWKNPFGQIFNQNYNTNTMTAFVDDTFHPTRNIALSAGFKSILSTVRVGDGYLNPAYYGLGAAITSGESLTASSAFLPHLAADWHFLKHHELFVDISKNLHTYAECGYNLCNSPLAVSQSAFALSRGGIKPETAWTYAAGYRFNGDLVSASVYAYRTNFKNRLQQITAGSLINPISAVQNVGGVTMNGVDAAITITPIMNLRITNAVSYNHSTYDQNITNSGVSFPTAGKQVVNFPRFMYNTSLAYQYGAFSPHIDAAYIGPRNYAYTGDVKVGGYWMTNLGVRYRLATATRALGVPKIVKNVELSFDISNLLNTRYISTMGENGNPMSISTGALTTQSMLPGAPRVFFGSLRIDF
ncbi:TonB-dependent receptor [Nguyenibacter sp. L1]|uniref:TonB-dependent receptor n=1 Tax=Nguyenibacter sp. L1 TaxID=3049350 RepID=UPI002B491E6F|nr:TonB-dependent receptor [Nguyenibacter sp. L1]WRH87567.1 TonB-dependent receptor [Nguyenibacter sp. L1]